MKRADLVARKHPRGLPTTTMRVCVLDLDDPWQPISYGGTQRTLALINAAVGAGHTVSVIYVPTSETQAPGDTRLELRPMRRPPLGQRRMPDSLRRLKRELLPMPTMVGARIGEFGRTVADLSPEVLIVTELRAAPYVGQALDAALWLDHADLWSTFLGAEIARRRGVPRLTARAQQIAIERTERRWAQGAAALSTAGYDDRHTLRGQIGRDVVWLPTPSGVAEIPPPPASEEPVAGFLANFAYRPNRDAFEVLKGEWAPALKRQGWKTIVAGLHSDQLDGGESVEVVGPIPRVEEYYARVHLTLAPMRLGGGIKVKVLESLMAGRPLLATAQGLRGLPPELVSRIPQVSVERPDVEFLAAGPPASVGLRRLAASYFSPTVFEAKVASLLKALGTSPGRG